MESVADEHLLPCRVITCAEPEPRRKKLQGLEGRASLTVSTIEPRQTAPGDGLRAEWWGEDSWPLYCSAVGAMMDPFTWSFHPNWKKKRLLSCQRSHQNKKCCHCTYEHFYKMYRIMFRLRVCELIFLWQTWRLFPSVFVATTLCV